MTVNLATMLKEGTKKIPLHGGKHGIYQVLFKRSR